MNEGTASNEPDFVEGLSPVLSGCNKKLGGAGKIPTPAEDC